MKRMEGLLYLVERLGVALTFAASVFYIAFYFSSIRDGVIDATERRFMHIGYQLLRIGMGFIVTTSLIALLRALIGGSHLSDLFWFLLFLLAVMLGNEVLLALHREPNWLSPFLQASSWYAYFTAYTLMPTSSFLTLVVYYLVWLLVALVAFNLIKARIATQALPPTIT